MNAAEKTKSPVADFVETRKGGIDDDHLAFLAGQKQDCSVYVIETGQRTVKVGISKNLYRRIADIQCSQPVTARVFYAVRLARSEARQVERAAHKQLSRHRLKGEWFSVSAVFAASTIQQEIQRLGFSAAPNLQYGVDRGIR